MIATIIVATEPRRSAGFRKEPTSWFCADATQFGVARGMSCDSPNSALRKGTSSVNEKTSSAAAMMLHAIVPAIRHECGRK